MTTSTAKDSIGSDSVRLYLSEIGQVPLLTADEEKDLGKKIKAGLVAQAKLKSPSDVLSFACAARPALIFLPKSFSSSAVSNGTWPISLKYKRTESDPIESLAVDVVTHAPQLECSTN